MEHSQPWYPKHGEVVYIVLPRHMRVTMQRFSNRHRMFKKIMEDGYMFKTEREAECKLAVLEMQACKPLSEPRYLASVDWPKHWGKIKVAAGSTTPAYSIIPPEKSGNGGTASLPPTFGKMREGTERASLKRGGIKKEESHGIAIQPKPFRSGTYIPKLDEKIFVVSYDGIKRTTWNETREDYFNLSCGLVFREYKDARRNFTDTQELIAVCRAAVDLRSGESMKGKS